MKVTLLIYFTWRWRNILSTRSPSLVRAQIHSQLSEYTFPVSVIHSNSIVCVPRYSRIQTVLNPMVPKSSPLLTTTRFHEANWSASTHRSHVSTLLTLTKKIVFIFIFIFSPFYFSPFSCASPRIPVEKVITAVCSSNTSARRTSTDPD